MSKLFVRLATALFLVLALFGLSACSPASEDSEPAASKESPQSAPAAKLTAAQEAALATILAAADAVDGESDKVVSKCSSCSLHMDGKAEHTLPIAGYDMHFCSAACKDRFDEDLAGHVLKMNVPES